MYPNDGGRTLHEEQRSQQFQQRKVELEMRIRNSSGGSTRVYEDELEYMRRNGQVRERR